MKSVRSIWSSLVSRKFRGLVSVGEENYLPKINTLNSRINVPGRLLILEKAFMQDMFIPSTSYGSLSQKEIKTLEKSLHQFPIKKLQIIRNSNPNPFKTLIKATVRRSMTSFESFKKKNSTHTIYSTHPVYSFFSKNSTHLVYYSLYLKR